MKHIRVDGMNIAYREQGEGPAVLLVHGWPTSSFLYRNIIPHIAKHNRVIALDMPGFGGSDKPLDVRYTFDFFAKTFTGFLDAVGVDDVGLCVHDLGGPVGLYWACQNQPRIRRLALLNTLVYPEVSWAVIAFGIACRTPGLRRFATSKPGLTLGMKIGVHHKSRINEDVVEGVVSPFRTREARQALIRSVLHLSPRKMKEIGATLPSFDVPVRVIYGKKDRILPDVADTMARVKRDLPQTEVTELPDCGHFLQEDRPNEIGRLLAEFFHEKDAASG